jgi:hypothetical protein
MTMTAMVVTATITVIFMDMIMGMAIFTPLSIL